MDAIQVFYKESSEYPSSPQNPVYCHLKKSLHAALKLDVPSNIWQFHIAELYFVLLPNRITLETLNSLLESTGKYSVGLSSSTLFQ